MAVDRRLPCFYVCVEDLCVLYLQKHLFTEVTPQVHIFVTISLFSPVQISSHYCILTIG